VAVLCVAAPCHGQQAPATDAAPAYLIGPEDVLDIAVWNNTDISRTVPVRPDGKISLPLLNDIVAAGMTPMALRDAIVRALATYMPSPSVSIIVREVHSFKVTVIGEVRTPGRYELRGRATVLDLLAMAGGLSDFASRGHIVVLRQDGTATRQIPFSYDRLATSKAPDAALENFCMQPGDIILVP